MIWASVKRLFFIGISSSILPRKFYLRIPLTMGRITAAHSPKAFSEKIHDEESRKGNEDRTRLRADWQAVSQLLRFASAIDSVDISSTNLDPWRSGDYCEQASSFNEVHDLLLRDYFTTLARFQLIWNAYELIRNSSRIGRYVKGNVSFNATTRQVGALSLEYYPYLRVLYEQLDGLWIAEPHPLRANGHPPIIKSRILRKFKNCSMAARAGLTLNEYRNYLFHGDEEPPSPDESFDHFGDKTALRRSTKVLRMEAAANLALLMICLFSSDWMPSFYASSTAQEENLYLVDLEFTPGNGEQVMRQLLTGIFVEDQATSTEATLLL